MTKKSLSVKTQNNSPYVYINTSRPSIFKEFQELKFKNWNHGLVWWALKFPSLYIPYTALYNLICTLYNLIFIYIAVYIPYTIVFSTFCLLHQSALVSFPTLVGQQLLSFLALVQPYLPKRKTCKALNIGRYNEIRGLQTLAELGPPHRCRTALTGTQN